MYQQDSGLSRKNVSSAKIKWALKLKILLQIETSKFTKEYSEIKRW